MHLVKENRTCKGAIISDSRHPENLNFKTANKFVPGVGHELQILRGFQKVKHNLVS